MTRLGQWTLSRREFFAAAATAAGSAAIATPLGRPDPIPRAERPLHAKAEGVIKLGKPFRWGPLGYLCCPAHRSMVS